MGALAAFVHSNLFAAAIESAGRATGRAADPSRAVRKQ